MGDAVRREIDAAMLDSLATWFRIRAGGYNGPHSFNEGDVAEMLQRAAHIVKPRIFPVPGKLDPYTIERAAEMVIANALKWDDAEDIAAAIRALKGEG